MLILRDVLVVASKSVLIVLKNLQTVNVKIMIFVVVSEYGLSIKP